MIAKHYVFLEKESGTFCLERQFRLKSHYVAKDTFEVDKFCWQLRDGINGMVENHVKFECVSNLSKKRKNGTNEADCREK